MVRFIINKKEEEWEADGQIYIPIWLDLLYLKTVERDLKYYNLHSNMVRFIMQE